jgi:hypothetical protein
LRHVASSTGHDEALEALWRECVNPEDVGHGSNYYQYLYDSQLATIIGGILAKRLGKS